MLRRAFAVLALLAGVVPALAAPARADGTVPAAVYIQGLDLHDGAVTKAADGEYVLVGTLYGCGFQWAVAGTSWCGFGYSTAGSLAGPWSTPKLLFSPGSTDPWTRTTWADECGSTGAGCFNPRLVQRRGWGADDGAWLLLFNSPADYNRNHSNAYNVMGCGVAGTRIGCGPGEKVSGHGSYTKPSLNYCNGNGDVGVFVGNGALDLMCTMPGQTLSVEQLNRWGTGTSGLGASHVGGLKDVEGPGVYQDPATGTWIATFSDTNCGYCSGDGTGYATARNPLGPYVSPVNLGFSAPAQGRRDLSATSCGGQPRTVSVLDGQAWQGIDLWTGSRNETTAGLLFQPLTYTGTPAAAAGDGTRWSPPFVPWTC